MKKEELIKRANQITRAMKQRDQTKLMNVRLTPAEIEELREIGYGCITSGLRRVMNLFRINQKDNSKGG